MKIKKIMKGFFIAFIIICIISGGATVWFMNHPGDQTKIGSTEGPNDIWSGVTMVITMASAIGTFLALWIRSRVEE